MKGDRQGKGRGFCVYVRHWRFTSHGWRITDAVHLFKKGSRDKAENVRSVGPTSVLERLLDGRESEGQDNLHLENQG